MNDVKIVGVTPNTRWSSNSQFGSGKTVESPAYIEAFLDEYEALCKKHNLTLGHEDGHGGFLIEPFGQSNVHWVRAASMVGLGRRK